MATTRLTNIIRDQISSKLLELKFQKESEQINEDKMQLAEDIYDDVFDSSQKDLMEKLPNGWMPTTDHTSKYILKMVIMII